MANRTYISTTTRRSPKPRSDRLRAIGTGSVTSTVISLGGSSGGGVAGEDGFSPTISFEVEGSVLTVRVVNKTGINEYEIDLGESTGVDALREDFEKCCREMTEEVRDLRDTIDELKRMMKVVTFTVVPMPADAKVTINGEERASVSVFAGAEVEWRVEADGYITRTDSQTVTEDTTVEVVLADLGSLISSFSYDDIDAGGGSVLPKVEAVEGATFTYSGAGVDADTGEVSADSLGTTLKDRTRITTVTVTAEVDGSTATATCDVYQQANEVVSHKATGTTYGKPAITGGHTYDDIGAGGGTVTPTAPAYNQTKTTGYTDTYTSGATAPGEYEDEIIRSGAAITYSGTGVDTSTGAVTASSLGTTEKTRTKVATSTVTVTMNGQSASEETDVYQAENKVESESSETTYGTPSVSLSYAKDIPAGGGSVSPTLSYSQTKATGHSYTYTSGEVKSDGTTETITSGADVTYSGTGVDTSTGSVGADGLGTTLKDRTKITTSTATVTMNGKSASKSADVYQEANEVTATETSVTYGDVEVLEFSYEDVPASGGTVYPNVSYRQMSYDTVTSTYTSGGTETSSTERGYITDGASFKYSGQWKTGAVTGENLGTTEKERTSLGIVYISVTLNGGRAAVECEVYQQENKVESTTKQFIGESLEFRTFEYADDIPAEGGTVYPTVEVRYIHEYRNGYVYTSGSVEWDTDSWEATSVTPDEMKFVDTTLKFFTITLDSVTGAATAGAATSTERQSLTTVIAYAYYTSPETGAGVVADASAEVWQEGLEAYLTAPSAISFGTAAGSATGTVDSSSAWTAEVSDSWLSVSPSSGASGATTVTIGAEVYKTLDGSRRGTVTFTNTDGLTRMTDVLQGSGNHFTLTVNYAFTVAVGSFQTTSMEYTVDGVMGGFSELGSTGSFVLSFAEGAVVEWRVYATVDGVEYSAGGTVTMDSDRTVNVTLG